MNFTALMFFIMVLMPGHPFGITFKSHICRTKRHLELFCERDMNDRGLVSEDYLALQAKNVLQLPLQHCCLKLECDVWKGKADLDIARGITRQQGPPQFQATLMGLIGDSRGKHRNTQRGCQRVFRSAHPLPDRPVRQKRSRALGVPGVRCENGYGRRLCCTSWLRLSGESWSELKLGPSLDHFL